MNLLVGSRTLCSGGAPQIINQIIIFIIYYIIIIIINLLFYMIFIIIYYYYFIIIIVVKKYNNNNNNYQLAAATPRAYQEAYCIQPTRRLKFGRQPGHYRTDLKPMTSLTSKSNGSHASSAFQDLYDSVTDMSGINSLKQSFQDLKKSNTAAASAVLVGSPSNGSSASTAHSSKANAIINRVAKDVNRSIAKRSLSKAPLSSRDISKAFEPFDVNRDGLVTRKEFHQGLQSVAPSITAEDTKNIVENVTATRGDGDLIPYLNVSKLLTKLGNEQQLVTEKSNGKHFAQTSTDASVSLAEDRLLTRFSGSSNRLRHAFKRADTDGDQRLDSNEFKRSLLKLNVDIDENQIDKLIAKYDVDSNGTVDYGKLVDSIDSERKNRNLGSQRSRSPSSLAKEVVDKMFKNSSVEMMAKHFRDLNVEKCGTLDGEVVERGLRLQGANLSQGDMKEFLDAAKSPHRKNRVDYRKLINLMHNADLPEEVFSKSRSKKMSDSEIVSLDSNPNSNSSNAPWWDRSNKKRKEGMTLGNVDMIIDHDQKVKTLNGRKTSRRASLHFQKTNILPTGNLAVSETATSNYGGANRVADNGFMPPYGREKTVMEKTEGIVSARVAHVVKDRINQLKQVYDDVSASSNKNDLTYKELKNGFRDCGIQLGNEDFNRFVSAADRQNRGRVSFEDVCNMVQDKSNDIGKNQKHADRQKYVVTSSKAMPAGLPSSKNHSVEYDNAKLVVPVHSSSSSLFEDKRLYEGAAPTYVTSVMQQPSTDFFANNRRKVVSPPGNALRPNTSIEFGRTTGNILLADSLAGKIPAENRGAHLYGRSGHAVARDGRRQMKLPEDVTHKETGHRFKDLLYNSGASIDAGETDLILECQSE